MLNVKCIVVKSPAKDELRLTFGNYLTVIS